MNEVDSLQRLAVARATNRLGRGEITRREWLAACSQAGFALGAAALLTGPRPAMAAPLTPAQIKATAGPKSAIDPASDAHKFLADTGKTFAGTTLRIVTEDTPPSQATKEIMKQEFIALTGIKVEWELLPLHRVLAKISADTARQAGVHDIFYFDQAWVGRFFEDTVPVPELLAKKSLAYPAYDFADILPALVEHLASYKGHVAGIPIDIPVQIVMYRKDVLDKLQLAPPKTLAEYMNVVKAIHSEMQPRMTGTTGMWKAGHYALTVDACPWLWAHGGSFFGPDGQPTINDERAHAAMDYMMTLGKFMPPEATTWDWTAEAVSFARGRSGIFINAGEWFSVFDDPSQSKVVGLVEAAPCPAELALRKPAQCSFEETPGISRQGGSYLGISRYSKNIDAAWVFLQWVTSSDITTRASLLGGGASPIRQSTFDDPRIKARAAVGVGTTRHFGVTLDAINHRMGTEPHGPSWPTLSIDFAVELGKMTTGQQNVKTTLDNMARQARRSIAPAAKSRA